MSTFTGGNPAAQFVDMATIQASPYAPFLTACDKTREPSSLEYTKKHVLFHNNLSY